VAKLPGSREVIRIENLILPMFGSHNAQNALVAVAVALELGITQQDIRKGLAKFKGVRRRFTKVGEIQGITIIDDYGHHPVEIAAVLAAARSVAKGRVIAVAQPHRYSRLQDQMEGFCTCFNDADQVIVAPVYPAGEKPISGVDHNTLADGLIAHGHKEVKTINDPSDLAGLIAKNATSGDYVICLGAGTITQWAGQLPNELEQILAP